MVRTLVNSAATCDKDVNKTACDAMKIRVWPKSAVSRSSPGFMKEELSGCQPCETIFLSGLDAKQLSAVN